MKILSNAYTLDSIADGEEYKKVSEEERTLWNNKQDNLVSGQNIKTINGASLLGSSNIEVSKKVAIQDNPPANPSEGDLWIDSDEQPVTNANIKNEYSTSQTDAYSCNYVNGMITPTSINKNLVIEDYNVSLDDLCNRSAIYGRISSDVNVGADYHEFNNLYSVFTAGNKLSISNGKIKVGKNVKHILFFVKLGTFQGYFGDKLHYMHILKNGTNQNGGWYVHRTYGYDQITNWVMLEVQENDIISFSLYCESATTIESGRTNFICYVID